MDNEIEKRVKESIELLQQVAVENIDFDQMDPIVKMMLVALLHEGQKIRDYIDSTPQKVVERFCADFIPYEKVGAVPAIALLAPTLKQKEQTVMVGADPIFTLKISGSKQALNYIPVFNTLLIPPPVDNPKVRKDCLFVLTPHQLTYNGEVRPVSTRHSNKVWIGIETAAEIETLYGLSMLIEGTGGLIPERVVVGAEHRELEVSSMREMENLEMVEPFDAQQVTDGYRASGHLFSFVNAWKENLLNMEDAALIYVTDKIKDRDLFKRRSYPKAFQQLFEDDVLDYFKPETLWLRLDFPEGYTIPEAFKISINILPVVNVDVCSLMLTQAAPIQKLQKQEGAFFLKVLEASTASQQQGFSMSNKEILIRDFDANVYHNGDLYRDVRHLYNRFIDDYYAFTEYNAIKDGEVLRRLRETINRLGKSVGETNEKFKYDSGTYVMRNMSQESMPTTTKVTYITTMGSRGNEAVAGGIMESRRLPAIHQKVDIKVSAMGGTDKATADERYELLRYYALTNDRLYTKMDVDAFVRKEIMAKYGKDEFRRIFIRISIQGAGGNCSLRRGLYIDIDFKDQKNYDIAVQSAFDKMLQLKIENLSCIAMPIIIKLKNMEGQEL